MQIQGVAQVSGMLEGFPIAILRRRLQKSQDEGRFDPMTRNAILHPLKCGAGFEHIASLIFGY